MAKIEFDTGRRAELVNKIQGYFKSELDQELAQFDGEFLLDFITETLGGHFYNQGLMDAQAILLGRMDNITEAIDELVQPI
jgi:uncharacterized protein (DUF2164 family)